MKRLLVLAVATPALVLVLGLALAGCSTDSAATATCEQYASDVLAPMADANERFAAKELTEPELRAEYVTAGQALVALDAPSNDTLATALAAAQAVPSVGADVANPDFDPTSPSWQLAAQGMLDACSALGVDVAVRP